MSTQWVSKGGVVDAAHWDGGNLAEVQALAPGAIELDGAGPNLIVRRPSEDAFSIPLGARVIRSQLTDRIAFYESAGDFHADYQPMTTEPEPGPVVLQFELSNKGAGAIANQLARQIVSALPQQQPAPPCDRAHADDRADGAVVVWAEDLRLYFGSLAGTLRGGDLAKAEGARRRLREAAGL